jgi:hypothetical protein
VDPHKHLVWLQSATEGRESLISEGEDEAHLSDGSVSSVSALGSVMGVLGLRWSGQLSGIFIDVAGVVNGDFLRRDLTGCLRCSS